MSVGQSERGGGRQQQEQWQQQEQEGPTGGKVEWGEAHDLLPTMPRDAGGLVCLHQQSDHILEVQLRGQVQWHLQTGRKGGARWMEGAGEWDVLCRTGGGGHTEPPCKGQRQSNHTK